jgi:AraC family transcriptional regulator
MDHGCPITYLTADTRTASVAGFTFMDGRFAGGLRIPVHYHEGPTLAVILQGSFEERLSTRTHTCETRSLVVKPAGETHRDAFSAPGRAIAIEISPARLSYLSPFLPDEAVYCQNEDAETIARHIARELRAPEEPASVLALEGLALELLGATARRVRTRPTQGPHWLRLVVDLLNDVPCEMPTIADMARIAGVHPVHLARVFKKCTGRSIGVYARRLRLQWAARRLTSTNEPIASIAHQACFFDQSHFSRTFALEIGFTPSQYRRLFGGATTAID